MAGVVADTHALVWYLIDSPRISGRARGVLAGAIASGYPVFVSAISLIEVIYLGEKGRIPADDVSRFQGATRRPDRGIAVVPIDMAIVGALGQIARTAVPDLPDRIIAATALHLGVPLISRDGRIRASGLETIW